MAALQSYLACVRIRKAFARRWNRCNRLLYSIASSHNATPGKRIAYVDAFVTWSARASALDWLRHFWPTAQAGDQLKVYVRKAVHFALPQVSENPIIMIGPGHRRGGRFRAFLLDRQATLSRPARTGCFYVHQRSDCDFFYSDELNANEDSGLLTRNVACVVARWRQEIPMSRTVHASKSARVFGPGWPKAPPSISCGDAQLRPRCRARAVSISSPVRGASTDEVPFVAEPKRRAVPTDVY